MKVYSSPNLTMVAHMKQVLDGHDIACRIHNEFIGAGIGELAPTLLWPELWVTDDAQSKRALEIIERAIEAGEGDETAWKCPSCDEELEGQFTVCWKCGTERVVSG